jgi:membrane associated rhomboid family serine protease
VDSPLASAPTVCYRHPDRPTRLRCSECGRYICVECSRDAVVGQKCPECTNPEQRTRVIPVRTMAHVDRRATPVTWALIAINVVIFLVGEVSPSLQTRIFDNFAQAPPVLAPGQWWRLFTAMFLHANILHILFNMYALWLFGPVLERRFGASSYAALYLASGVTGGMLFQLMNQSEWALGASGAIFGLFGALLAASYRQRHTRAGAAIFGQLMLLLALNMALPLFIPSLAWQAHVGGLAAGVVIAAAWDHMPLRGKGAAARRTALAAALGVLSLVIALLL